MKAYCLINSENRIVATYATEKQGLQQWRRMQQYDLVKVPMLNGFTMSREGREVIKEGGWRTF